MEHNNLIEIYGKLKTVSTQLHEDFDFDAHGFDKCLFMLQHALKNYAPINLHIENHNLKNKLLNIEQKHDSYSTEKSAFYIRNGELLEENNLLKQQLKTANAELAKIKSRPSFKHSAGFNKVEIDFEGQNISFLINTDKELFDNNFKDATNYIFSKRKKRVHLSTIKNWYLEWYRSLGFTCVPG